VVGIVCILELEARVILVFLDQRLDLRSGPVHQHEIAEALSSRWRRSCFCSTLNVTKAFSLNILLTKLTDSSGETWQID
jgi:hypothetical protein